MSKCERANKWIRGCNWETVYDLKKPCDELKSQIMTTWQLPQWLAKLGVHDYRYVGSICKTCGKYIPREGEMNNE